MAVVAARSETKRHSRSEYCIELGILNNMPGPALERTERQFFAVVAAAAHDLLVRVHFFSLDTIERDDSVRALLHRHAYARAGAIPDRDLDALIVTGTEPRESDLRREPYWPELAQLFDWLQYEGPSTLFSCLAAHAAVLHYDGIPRRPLAEKRFGNFDHAVARRDPLTHNLSPPFTVAHSRWNELAERDLAAGGYRILTWSQEAGVELFVRREHADFLFCQGHLEYDRGTLAREYRRDVRRWLAGAASAYPQLPKNYFSSAETVTFEQFRARAAFERSEALMMEFPALARKPEGRANPAGAQIVRAWLESIVEKKRSGTRFRDAAAQPDFATVAA
ncbi:MAG TPA: homoserine O-succinyltransferase [Rhizomicrobium sp.]|jgi:homoserine O-succinyltransferase|nr:homoserine O-succinyltransferase [Rhizomicrobium sp.]